MVLDLGHCKSNDKSLANAREMIEKFRDRIMEIHLSGYVIFHEPLHRTHQDDIIELCRELPDVPIIIESTFEENDTAEDVYNEINYILERL